MKKILISLALALTCSIFILEPTLASDGIKGPIIKLATVYEDGKAILNLDQPASNYFQVTLGDSKKTVKVSLDLDLSGNENLLLITELKRPKISAFSPDRGSVVGQPKGEGLAISNISGTVYVDIEGFVDDDNNILAMVIDENNLTVTLQIRTLSRGSLLDRISFWIPITVLLTGLASWLVMKRRKHSVEKEKW
jgi:hypothetical protein